MFSSIKFIKHLQYKQTLRQKFSVKFFSSDNKHESHSSGNHSQDHNEHSQNHDEHHGEHSNDHGDHHDHHHHEITGEVDLGRVYVPLSNQVKLK